MSQFEKASEFVICGGQFTQVAGDVYLGPHEDSRQPVRRLVEKDVSLNQYSVEHGTLSIPHFSKSLLLRDLDIDTDAGRISKGSCSFDLLARLGLFPGQPNEALAEYDVDVPLNEVISRNNCYCGRISRHGFVFLVSKYFQHASMAEATGGGTCIILTTSIGRFKCYEIADRTFIHFDSGTRSSYVDLITDQNLDDILRSARGEHLINGSGDNLVNKIFEWRRQTGEPLESTASGQFYGVPKAIIYMNKLTLQRWKKLKEFSYSMINTVLSVLEELREPIEFVAALNNLPQIDKDSVFSDTNIAMSTPAEKMASTIYLFRSLLSKNFGMMPYESFHSFGLLSLADLLDAHKHFRSPKIELAKLIKTSHDRFLHILDEFQRMDNLNPSGRLGNGPIQRELQNLLKNKNNIALVAFQGFLALLSQWNVSRVLSRAREAPNEWIQFVAADDDELFIG